MNNSLFMNKDSNNSDDNLDESLNILKASSVLKKNTAKAYQLYKSGNFNSALVLLEKNLSIGCR